MLCPECTSWNWQAWTFSTHCASPEVSLFPLSGSLLNSLLLLIVQSAHFIFTNTTRSDKPATYDHQTQPSVCVGGHEVSVVGGKGGKSKQSFPPLLHSFLHHEGVRLQLQSTHAANSSSFITNTVLWKSLCLLLHWFLSNRHT